MKVFFCYYEIGDLLFDAGSTLVWFFLCDAGNENSISIYDLNTTTKNLLNYIYLVF